MADRLTAREAAALAGCPLQTVYSAVRLGHLEAQRFGQQLSFERSEVEAWAAGSEVRLSGRRKGKLKRK